jgi:NAD(P)-dependent dehydrogenase (short-subunit alcohol dehydrogenase family)
VRGAVDLERTPTGADFHAIRTYASTKLWNLVATLERARRWADTRVTVNAVHPGVVSTGLGDRRGLLGFVLRVAKRWWLTPEEGADAPVWLATAPELDGVSGAWFDRRARKELPPAVTDPALGARVWEATERLLR